MSSFAIFKFQFVNLFNILYPLVIQKEFICKTQNTVLLTISNVQDEKAQNERVLLHILFTFDLLTSLGESKYLIE